jgi:hypothetical protein
MTLERDRKKKKPRDNNKLRRKRKLVDNKKPLKRKSKHQLEVLLLRNELRKKNPKSKHKSQAGE